MSAWISPNTPRPGEEWTPEKGNFLLQPKEPILIPEDFERNMGVRSERQTRDVPCRKEEKHVIIEDPLAYYVSYHSPEMGIYFRVNRMLSDFRGFVSKYTWPYGIGVDELWHIYVMTVFWHEMAHHVVEDVATILEWTLGGHHYPLMPRRIEEGFCEFYAFHTVERQPSLPRPCMSRMPIINARVPLGIVGKKNTGIRRIILSCLYYHWGRGNPASIHRPRIDPVASQAVDGLWNGLWGAHTGGYKVVKAPTEIYKEIFFTPL